MQIHEHMYQILSVCLYADCTNKLPTCCVCENSPTCHHAFKGTIHIGKFYINFCLLCFMFDFTNIRNFGNLRIRCFGLSRLSEARRPKIRISSNPPTPSGVIRRVRSLSFPSFPSSSPPPEAAELTLRLPPTCQRLLKCPEGVTEASGGEFLQGFKASPSCNRLFHPL